MSNDDDEIEAPYYVDGCVIAKEHVYIASKFESMDEEDYDFTRMVTYREGEWFAHDLEWDVRSVCCWREKGKWTTCALSTRGDVYLRTENSFSIERIPEAGADGLGALTQVRSIGGSLYACGFNGQVYRRESKGWVHFDAGLLEREPGDVELYLAGIDGTSDSDIYVVGTDGHIFHWDGKAWRGVKSPTKAHLERVRCVDRGEVYICGYEGAFLRGNARDGFHLLEVEEEEEFWGLEIFRDKVYLASLSGLFTLEGDIAVSLDTSLEPAIDGYRLDSADGVLWSFGSEDLAYFDGRTWTRVVDPDSE